MLTRARSWYPFILPHCTIQGHHTDVVYHPGAPHWCGIPSRDTTLWYTIQGHHTDVVYHPEAPHWCGIPSRDTTLMWCTIQGHHTDVILSVTLYFPFVQPVPTLLPNSEHQSKSCQYQFQKVLTLVLLNPDIPCLCKQCRSRSVGFWRSQLIWMCTVWLSMRIHSNNPDQVIWFAEKLKVGVAS